MTPVRGPQSVVIVGSGIAGLYAALRAARQLPESRITLCAKTALEHSNTWHAQGGIAAVLPDGQCAPGDSWQAHSRDTVGAGAGRGSSAAADVLCSEASQRIQDLLTYGVPLDRNDDGGLCLTREAAHSAARILHSGGDATGQGIAAALIAAVLAEPRITVRDHTFLIDVVVRSGRIAGAMVLSEDTVLTEGKAHAAGTEAFIAAEAVVLATGGAGQLFEHNTNPEVATADGVAVAWRAGAALADLEFFQFHPTSLDVPGNPLISEAVRGEGAFLLDTQGHRFMLDYHADGELAPRDVVSRSIMAHLRRTGGSHVYLDASSLNRGRSGYLAHRFPSLNSLTAAHGFDWAAEPVPVVPAAHYWMGGIRTDLSGRTSVPGLYAIGEVACTGVHGANRLASNSLLEGLVFAERAVASLASGRAEWPIAGVGPRRLSPSGTEPMTRQDLQRVMWEGAGVVRDRVGLEQAAGQLARFSVDQPAERTVRSLEDINLLTAARLLVHAAAQRSESVGAHFRSDCRSASGGPTTTVPAAEAGRIYARTPA